jgi:hypothetical protein
VRPHSSVLTRCPMVDCGVAYDRVRHSVDSVDHMDAANPTSACVQHTREMLTIAAVLMRIRLCGHREYARSARRFPGSTHGHDPVFPR